MHRLTCSMVALVLGQIRIPLILGLPEIGQDLFVGPSWVPELRPLIKVSLIASNIKHCVED